MKIDYAIPVRHIEPLADGTWAAMGIEIGGRAVRSFPAKIQLNVLLALSTDHVTAAGTVHGITVRVLDPHLEPAADEMTAEFNLTPGSASPPGWAARTIIPVLAVWTATEAGTYSVEITTSSGDSKSIPLVIPEPRS